MNFFPDCRLIALKGNLLKSTNRYHCYQEKNSFSAFFDKIKLKNVLKPAAISRMTRKCSCYATICNNYCTEERLMIPVKQFFSHYTDYQFSFNVYFVHSFCFSTGDYEAYHKEEEELNKNFHLKPKITNQWNLKTPKIKVHRTLFCFLNSLS